MWVLLAEEMERLAPTQNEQNERLQRSLGISPYTSLKRPALAANTTRDFFPLILLRSSAADITRRGRGSNPRKNIQAAHQEET